jgi:hypothetical protein
MLVRVLCVVFVCPRLILCSCASVVSNRVFWFRFWFWSRFPSACLVLVLCTSKSRFCRPSRVRSHTLLYFFYLLLLLPPSPIPPTFTFLPHLPPLTASSFFIYVGSSHPTIVVVVFFLANTQPIASSSTRLLLVGVLLSRSPPSLLHARRSRAHCSYFTPTHPIYFPCILDDLLSSLPRPSLSAPTTQVVERQITRALSLFSFSSSLHSSSPTLLSLSFACYPHQSDQEIGHFYF